MVPSLQLDTTAIWAGTGDPNGVITGSVGDIYVRTGIGFVQLYQNTNGTSTGWATRDGAASWTATAALIWTLVANTALALQIGPAANPDLLTFNTTSGADRVNYNGNSPFTIVTGGFSVFTGGFQAPHLAFEAFAVGVPAPTCVVQTDHPGGNVDVEVVLPVRPGGWRVLDATVRSHGGTAGTVQLRTAAGGGGNAVSDAIVPGNINDVSRNGELFITNQNFASGASMFWTGAGTPPQTTLYTTMVGL